VSEIKDKKRKSFKSSPRQVMAEALGKTDIGKDYCFAVY
jgi:hypothetical protein